MISLLVGSVVTDYLVLVRVISWIVLVAGIYKTIHEITRNEHERKNWNSKTRLPESKH